MAPNQPFHHPLRQSVINTIKGSQPFRDLGALAGENMKNKRNTKLTKILRNVLQFLKNCKDFVSAHRLRITPLNVKLQNYLLQEAIIPTIILH